MGKRYYFCGVGGNGMSPLARLLAARGAEVLGSDRSYDQGRNLSFFKQLSSEGIKLVKQDGVALDKTIDAFIVTRAVEESIPDVAAAKKLGLPIIKRPALMAELFRDSRNIAVGGTGGKSTTTGMIAHILKTVGKNPTAVDGAIMLNNNSNIMVGDPDLAVFEADESDGLNDVVGLCPANVAVLTNISLDHFELDELREIFTHFVTNAKEAAILNADCEASMSLPKPKCGALTFSMTGNADFSNKDLQLKLQIPGRHNIENGLAAIAACSVIGVDKKDAAEALSSFKGIKRRLELVQVKDGIRIIDDFSSNPGKIKAALSALKEDSKRLIVIFQPHGFQPTKLMKEGYIETFNSFLGKDDIIIMPEIYYVGGSANIVDGKEIPLPKDISSKDLINEIDVPKAYYFEKRAEIPSFIKEIAEVGDTVLVMGSRDETLPDFAREIGSKF